MSSPSASGPASEVFAIPELLQMILIECEMRDVLLWQRVDKTFYGVIGNCKALQEKLHLRPAAGTGKDPQEAELNPVLHEFLDRRLRSENPYRRFSMYMADNQLDSPHIKLAFYVGHQDVNATRCDELLGSGSWRRMSLSQPPLKLKNQNLWPRDKVDIWYGTTALDAVKCMQRVEDVHFAHPEFKQRVRPSSNWVILLHITYLRQVRSLTYAEVRVNSLVSTGISIRPTVHESQYAYSMVPLPIPCSDEQCSDLHWQMMGTPVAFRACLRSEHM